MLLKGKDGDGMKGLKWASPAGKKGSSLAEMCVVLAVVSIVALTVVSFTTMVSARSSVSAAKLKMMEDRQLTKIILESWLNRAVQAEAVVTVDANGNISASLPEGEPCTVLLEEDRIVAPVPGGDPLSCPINTLTSLAFTQMSHENGDAIYFCTAAYELPNPAGGVIQRTFTFTLNPHIGDVYEGVGA
jgi:competence protein ComGC